MDNVEREIREAELLGDLIAVTERLMRQYPHETEEQILERAEIILSRFRAVL